MRREQVKILRTSRNYEFSSSVCCGTMHSWISLNSNPRFANTNYMERYKFFPYQINAY